MPRLRLQKYGVLNIWKLEMKQLIKYILLLLIWLPPRTYAQTSDDFKNHVEILATFDGRKAGTDGCDKAAAYLIKTLESLNYKVEEQAFTYRGYNTKNILVTLGNGPEYIVAGAHYDGQNHYPSADDNASGTAVVLELAKSFKKVPAWRSVAFILFSGEEDGLVGSKFYCNHPLLPRDKPDIKKHIFFINLDMVGHLNDSKTIREIDLDELLIPLFAKYPFAQKVTLRSHNQDSDNFSFVQKGVQAVFVHTGLNSFYHTPRDTPATLNYDGMVQIHAYVEELIRTLAITCPDKLTETLNTLEYKP